MVYERKKESHASAAMCLLFYWIFHVNESVLQCNGTMGVVAELVKDRIDPSINSVTV